MKTIRLIAGLLIFTAMIISAQYTGNCKSKYAVKGTLTSTSKHCGGMRPTPEMERAFATPSPWAGKVLYIKKGTTNNIDKPAIDSVVTDDNGNFEIKLPKGQYILVDRDHLDRTFYDQILKNYSEKTDYYQPVDKECLKEWIEKPLLTFEVVKGGVSLSPLNIHKGCSWDQIPCAQYTGPYPP